MKKIPANKFVIWAIGLILIAIMFNIIPNQSVCDAAANYGLVQSIKVPVIDISATASTNNQEYWITTIPWVCDAFISQIITGGIILMAIIWLIAHVFFPDTKPKTIKQTN